MAQGLPSAELFSQGDSAALRLFYQNVLNRIAQLEQSAGKIGFNTDAAAPVNPPPSLARIAVTAHPGQNLGVAITNPQFLDSSIPGKRRGNTPRTPLTHILHWTYDPQFKKGVNELPPGTQTHYLIPTNGQKVYFRFQSSTDGVTYNQHQLASGQSK